MREVKETCDLCKATFDFQYALKNANIFFGDNLMVAKELGMDIEVCPNCFKKIELALEEAYKKTVEERKIE